MTGCIGRVESFQFLFEREAEELLQPTEARSLLRPRQSLVLQLFPYATRKGREQGGVGQRSTGLLGDRCEVRKRPSPGSPVAGKTTWGARGVVLSQLGIGARRAAPAGRAGKGPCRPQSAWAGVVLIRSGPQQSLTRTGSCCVMPKNLFS